MESAEETYASIKGPKTVYKSFYDPAETSFTAYLTKIKSLNPDALFIVGDSVHAAVIMKQAKAMGIRAQSSHRVRQGPHSF